MIIKLPLSGPYEMWNGTIPKKPDGIGSRLKSIISDCFSAQREVVELRQLFLEDKPKKQEQRRVQFKPAITVCLAVPPDRPTGRTFRRIVCGRVIQQQLSYKLPLEARVENLLNRYYRTKYL